MKGLEGRPRWSICSRNARPEKGLVRRPHLDQHGCPSQSEKASEPGRINLGDRRWLLDARNGDHTSHLVEWRGEVELSLISTRAVEDQSAPIPGEITSALGRIIFISQLDDSGYAKSCNLLFPSPSIRLGWKGCGLSPHES